MSYTQEFLDKVDLAAQSVSEQKRVLVEKIQNHLAPLLYARQGVARKIQSGQTMPEDHEEYVRKLEHVNNEISKLLGL